MTSTQPSCQADTRADPTVMTKQLSCQSNTSIDPSMMHQLLGLNGIEEAIDTGVEMVLYTMKTNL